MTRPQLILPIVGLILCLTLDVTEATLCKPYSTFKMDCNKCNCSSSGMEFTCTKEICWPLNYKEKYLIEENEQGYKILKPKVNIDTNDGRRLNNNNDLYINDGIVNSGKIKREQGSVKSFDLYGQDQLQLPYAYRRIHYPKGNKWNHQETDEDFLTDNEVSKESNRLLPEEIPPVINPRVHEDEQDEDEQDEDEQDEDERDEDEQDEDEQDEGDYEEDNDDDNRRTWGEIDNIPGRYNY